MADVDLVVKKKEVQEEEDQANAIIDLTDMDNDLLSMDNTEVEDFLDRMYNRGGYNQRKQDKRPREEEEVDRQAAKRHHSNPAVPSLAARLQEIFPQVHQLLVVPLLCRYGLHD